MLDVPAAVPYVVVPCMAFCTKAQSLASNTLVPLLGALYMSLLLESSTLDTMCKVFFTPLLAMVEWPCAKSHTGQGVDAQHVVHGVFIDIALNARFMGDCGRALRRQMLIDVHEHRVHRVGGGLIQIDVAPVVLQSVVHLLIQAGEVLVGIAVEQRIEADAGLRGPSKANGFIVEPGSNTA